MIGQVEEFGNNLSQTAQLEFKPELTRFCKILEPIARSLTCLEAPHSTCADIFLFWVAAASTLSEYLESQTFKFATTKPRIRKVTNARFNEMINRSDIYISTFALHPRKSSSVLSNLD